MIFPQTLTPTYGFPAPVPANLPTYGFPPPAPAENLPANFKEVQVLPQISANYILRDADTVTASGEVELRTRTLTVRADRAVIDTKTGEIQASGNVRILPVLPTVLVAQPAQ